eukprot:COSAG05_NODE_8696_length_680_cov_0.707401_1_plen_100_part_00
MYVRMYSVCMRVCTCGRVYNESDILKTWTTDIYLHNEKMSARMSHDYLYYTRTRRYGDDSSGGWGRVRRTPQRGVYGAHAGAWPTTSASVVRVRFHIQL